MNKYRFKLGTFAQRCSVFSKRKSFRQDLRWDYVLWWTRILRRVHGEIKDESREKAMAVARANEYYIKNKEKVLAYKKKWRLKRSEENPTFRIRQSTVANLRRWIEGEVGSVTEEAGRLLGCSIDQFKTHLESQFTQEMSWSNYGKKDGWQIDHIMPCASFNLEDEEELKKCFHFSNQRPLMRSDNLKKGDRLPDGRRGRDMRLIKQFGCPTQPDEIVSTV